MVVVGGCAHCHGFGAGENVPGAFFSLQTGHNRGWHSREQSSIPARSSRCHPRPLSLPNVPLLAPHVRRCPHLHFTLALSLPASPLFLLFPPFHPTRLGRQQTPPRRQAAAQDPFQSGPTPSSSKNRGLKRSTPHLTSPSPRSPSPPLPCGKPSKSPQAREREPFFLLFYFIALA